MNMSKLPSVKEIKQLCKTANDRELVQLYEELQRRYKSPKTSISKAIAIARLTDVLWKALRQHGCL
jgi:hypothetical protein